MLQRSTVTPYTFCCGLRSTARSYMSGCCGDEAESSAAGEPRGSAAGTEPWALGWESDGSLWPPLLLDPPTKTSPVTLRQKH